MRVLHKMDLNLKGFIPRIDRIINQDMELLHISHANSFFTISSISNRWQYWPRPRGISTIMQGTEGIFAYNNASFPILAPYSG